MKKFLSLPVFFALTLCSCENRQVSAVLDSVDSYIQERPDSALSVLRSISRDALGTKELRARYALDYTMALEKNYIDTTDLSVILPACKYYSKHGPLKQKMRAYFYQGCIYFNRNEDERAMNCFLLALEDSAQVDDNHYKELINSTIADIFSRNYNSEQELQYVLAALRYGRLDGDSLGVWRITGHLASVYANLQRYDEAEEVYRSFFETPEYDFHTYAGVKICYAKDLVRKRNPEPELSIRLLEEVAGAYPELMTTEAYCVYAYAHQLVGHDIVASSIIGQIEAFGKVPDIVSVWKYRILKEQGQYKQALQDLERSVSIQDSVVFATLTQSLIRTQRDYLKTRTEILKKENEADRQRICFIILISIVLIAVLVLLYFRRVSVLNKRLEKLSFLHQESQRMLDLESARTSEIATRLEEKEDALLSLRKQFALMYKARFKALNDLCAAYLSPVKKDRKDVLYDEAMRQLDIIINDKDSQDRFISLVNESLDNIIDKLRNDMPSHKEQDFRFLAFVFAGFDATTISDLTGYSIGTVYTKKNRLKTEISNMDSSFRDLYLRFFD